MNDKEIKKAIDILEKDGNLEFIKELVDANGNLEGVRFYNKDADKIIDMPLKVVKRYSELKAGE